MDWWSAFTCLEDWVHRRLHDRTRSPRASHCRTIALIAAGTITGDFVDPMLKWLALSQ